VSHHGHGHGQGHGHDHDAALATNETGPWPHSSTDPTATKGLRDRYEGEMYRRFRALKGAVRESIIARDALGLAEDASRTRPFGQVRGATQAQQRGDAAPLATAAQEPDINIAPAGRNEFAFPARERKVQGFMAYVDEQVDRGILQRSRRGRGVSAADPWQTTYLRPAYAKGVQHADAALVDEGVIPPDQTLDDVFRATRHADAAGLIYTRAFDELDGVTSAMGQQMSRELTDGLLAGENPRKVATRMNNRIDKVGLSRARLIARTETVRAHNAGALNRYQDVRGRLDGVQVKAEHVTAGDDRVCPICQSLAGDKYTLEEARGQIPVHPACRCTFIPVSRQSS
jgi:SPP1 gp7 family putative phage head morphogenesis protein